MIKQTNKLTKQQVLQIAKLADLKLSESEVTKYQKQLSQILDHIQLLNQVDTSRVKPTAQVTGLINIIRKDKIDSCLTQKEALLNSKSKHQGYFKVPAIFTTNE